MDSKVELLTWARKKQYKPENLEKVMKLLEVLQAFISVPYLKDRLVLKGGTALNLFYFKDFPRLSVDIDLNYIGSIDKSIMLQERPIINDAVQQILIGMGMTSYRNPTAYAGGKTIWQYESLLGQKGNLEIDLNYMYRLPLLDIEWKLPNISSQGEKIPILDLHELAAGKLAALFNRRASRDFFDAHLLMKHTHLSIEKLRPLWIAYLAINNVPLENLHSEYLIYDLKDIKNHLLPVLKQSNHLKNKENLEIWARKTLDELKESLSILLPLKPSEESFIHLIRTKGKIDPEMITGDGSLIHKLKQHPGLLWASLKV